MMKRLTLVLLVLLLALGGLLTGCSSSKGELVMGLDNAFPPMGFLDENNEIVGFDVDVAKEVAKRLDMTLKLQPIDWGQKESELLADQIDCLWNGYTITEDRKKQVIFTEPYMQNRQVIVVKKDSEINTLADLAGKSLVLQAESSAVDALEAAADLKASLKEVVELDDNVTAFMDLESGATDAMLIDKIVADYYITINSADFRILEESLAEEDYGVGFRPDDVKLRDQVQEQLAAMAADGTLAEISIIWFGSDITTISAD